MKFSELEQRLFDLLPKDGSRVTSRDLIEKYYGAERPFNARAIVIDRLKTIAAKAEHANAPWRVCKGPRVGPHPMEFWLEQA